jgi:hypothetical protein
MNGDGRVRYGIHPLLEAEANAWIYGSLKGVTSQSAKSDLLTPWKENNRREREVLTASGTCDAQIRQGIYGRAYNPVQTHLNSRDGVVPPTRGGQFDRDTLEELDGWQFR